MYILVGKSSSPTVMIFLSMLLDVYIYTTNSMHVLFINGMTRLKFSQLKIQIFLIFSISIKVRNIQ
jgi:hypothetical protein